MGTDIISDLLWFDVKLVEGKSVVELEAIKRLRFRELFFSYLDLDFDSSKIYDFLFFRSLSRPDYKKFFCDVIESIGYDSSKVVVEDFLQQSEYFNFEALAVFKENVHVIDFVQFDNQLIKEIVYYRFCLYVLICQKVSQIKARCFVSFTDCHPADNLLVNYFKREGVPTATLHHGLYVDYGDSDTINKLNYSIHPSDYFLAWGQSTADLIKKYHSNAQVKLCGKPYIFDNSNRQPATDLIYISLVLDQKLFEVENQEMINVIGEYCKENGCFLNVRVHPSKQLNMYDLSRVDRSIIVEKYDLNNSLCVIGHTSTLLYECLANDIPVFRFKTNVPTVGYDKNLEFNSIDQLKSIMLKFLPMKGSGFFKGLSKKYFSFNGGAAKNAYKKAFDEIIADPTPRVTKYNISGIRLNDVDFVDLRGLNYLFCRVRLGVTIFKPRVLFFGNESEYLEVKKQLQKHSDVFFIDCKGRFYNQCISNVKDAFAIKYFFGSMDFFVSYHVQKIDKIKSRKYYLAGHKKLVGKVFNDLKKTSLNIYGYYDEST